MTGTGALPAGEGAGPRIVLVLGTASGGTARHVAMLADGCARRGMAVTVLGPQSTRRLITARSAAGREPPAGELAFAPVAIGDRPRPAADAAAVLRLARLLRRARPGVVHAHGLRAGALTALALAFAFAFAPYRAARPPLLITVHNAPPADRRSAAAYRLLEHICARRADLVLCVSAGLAGRMRSLGSRRVLEVTVPAPQRQVPTAAAVTRARSDIGAAGRPVVLAVGRLAPQKGYPALLDAAACWQRHAPRPVLVIAGAGPLATALASESRDRGLDVRLLGQRDDVPALLAAADVFCAASSWEGQPLAVQEALRAGVPVVAFRTGGIPGLTGEHGALLVPPGEPARLAAAVLSVLDDAALAAQLAAGAAEAAARLPSEADAVAAAAELYVRAAAAVRIRPRPGRRTLPS